MILLMVPVVFLVVCVIVSLYINHRHKTCLKRFNGPKPSLILGNAIDLYDRKDLLGTIKKMTDTYEGIAKVWMGPLRLALIITDHKLLEFLLCNNKLIDKAPEYKYLRNWLGESLGFSTGSRWKIHRRIVTPAFHFNMLKQFIGVYQSSADILVEKLATKVNFNSTDIYDPICRCTLDIITATTFGESARCQEKEDSAFLKNIKEMTRLILSRSLSVLKRCESLYFFSKDRFKEEETLKYLHSYTYGVIQRRKEILANNPPSETAGTERFSPLLDTLLQANVHGHPIADLAIREELDNFLFAGSDTTATTLSFVLCTLADHPEEQQLAHEEQISIYGQENDQRITYEDLQNMTYLDLIIKETLRLYPGIPIYGRTIKEDTVYENEILPKGLHMYIFTYGLHRSPHYHVDPEKFNPKRFSNSESQIPFTYLPFSAGSRNCLGQKFAMLEMKTILSKILREFLIQPAYPRNDLIVTAELVLKSSSGFKIKLVKR